MPTVAHEHRRCDSKYGLATLRNWAEQSSVEPPVLKHSVALRLFFGHMSRPERLRAMLEAYGARSEQVVAELERLRADLGDDPRWAYPALVAEWGLHYYAAERDTVRWLAERLPAARDRPTSADPSA